MVELEREAGEGECVDLNCLSPYELKEALRRILTVNVEEGCGR